jgi:hypothetical protein
MLTYLDILPEDILTIIYKCLYTLIIKDLNNNDNYKNTIYFHRLLEIANNPLFDNLDYLGLLNINYINSKYNILKYKKNRIEYDDFYQHESAIYNKTYYTSVLNMDVDKIVIYNQPLYSLYKTNKLYYITIHSMIKKYLNITNLNLFNDTIVSQKISKSNFILQKNEQFKCLAELLYHTIEFYNIIKDVIYINIELLEDIENDGRVLTRRQRKDKYILEDMRNYHFNCKYIVRFDNDVDTKTAIPILSPL